MAASTEIDPLDQCQSLGQFLRADCRIISK